jgi:quercetin dioxygenase-like cupin family protein
MNRHYLKLILPFATVLLLVSCNERTDNQAVNTPPTDTTAVVKTEANFRPAYNTSQSVTVVAPNLYKMLSDTLGLRVLEATYKPGDSTTIHSHPDFAMYVLQGGKVEISSEEHGKQQVEFITGTAMVLPAESHTAKNIGNTTLKLVVVEADRPRN